VTFFWVTHMRSVLVILDYSRNDYCPCLVVLLQLLLPICVCNSTITLIFHADSSLRYRCHNVNA
jgi:hypothetical protein